MKLSILPAGKHSGSMNLGNPRRNRAEPVVFIAKSVRWPNGWPGSRAYAFRIHPGTQGLPELKAGLHFRAVLGNAWRGTWVILPDGIQSDAAFRKSYPKDTGTLNVWDVVAGNTL